ncbi:hypothetical protein V502_03737 [Pseudogymnoascus sp. VKM F-4520 (FW-2644)]|nr:hypothetical protein V502_03737 [Pseudogymnoascus sp. VKM F-4520 (FW-2644)]
MHFLVYLGFVLALCGVPSAAPAAAAALLQDGHLGSRCSVTTIYVTVTEDPHLPEVKTFGVAHHLVITALSVKTFGVAHHLAQTQHVGAVPDGLTTTVTRTHTGFETVVITVDISGVSRSDAHIGESTSIRFLHDGLSPTEEEENNVSATLTTSFKPLSGTKGPKIPVTVNTTPQNLAVPTGMDGFRASLTVNTGSQYLTAPTGTAATNDPVTVNTTSQDLTAPTGTGVSMAPVTDNTTAPTRTQSVSGHDGVVIETLTVYPVKSILPETGSTNTVAVAPTPQDPVSASLFPTSSETAPSPPQLTTLAAMKGFSNDQTKPLKRKDALGAIPFVVATPNAPASEYMAPPADTHAPRVPPDVETTLTLRLPFITVTFPVDISQASTYTSGRSFSTYTPGPGEKALRTPTPPADSTTAPSTLLQAAAVQSLPYKPVSCGEQGIFRLTFDDIPRPASPANSNDIQPQPISSPYHHFYFSQGFVVSPPPNDPYAAKSPPHLLEFVTPSNLNPTRTHNSPPIDDYSATAVIGIGQNLRWGCYDFNALAASVGCDSLGPQCEWQFTGVQFDHEKQEFKEVVTQYVSTASCPGLEDCKLSDVVLLDEFMHLHALKVNVTAAGEPKNWWMDDLKLGWADGSCDAGLCRVMHR